MSGAEPRTYPEIYNTHYKNPQTSFPEEVWGFLFLTLHDFDSDYFNNFYRTFQLGPDGGISLLRNDGLVLVRWPMSDRSGPSWLLGPRVASLNLACRKPLSRKERSEADRMPDAAPSLLMARG